MNLEILKQRKTELEQTATSLASKWQTIQGHKSEIEFWIGELERVAQELLDKEPEVATQ